VFKHNSCKNKYWIGSQFYKREEKEDLNKYSINTSIQLHEYMDGGTWRLGET
jgi:hypothetical protein